MTDGLIDVRRFWIQVEDVHHEFGPPSPKPLRRGAIGVVLTNPYAGRHVTDILPLMKALEPLGVDLAERLLRAMSVLPQRIQGYGKGAIVGGDGELEHGALWHVPGGYAMRALLGWKGDPSDKNSGGSGIPGQKGNALAIVPSTKKVGPPGASLDVPLTNINASYVRSHFDAMEVRVPGAPTLKEIVYFLVMSTGARIHARVGGLKINEISRWDGQR